MLSMKKQTDLVDAADLLPGRAEAIDTAELHFVNGAALMPPYPKGTETATFAMGCFWGAERLFWKVKGVHVTAVGYAGGGTPNPKYREVCSGLTNHAEAVLVVFDPQVVSYEELLKVFWEGHDPTQGMRQGNDAGTQYRSAIYVGSRAQREAAERSMGDYAAALSLAGYSAVTTEIAEAGTFHFAEEEHQQYLAKNPYGYCGLGKTGVVCQVGTGIGAPA